MEMIVSFFQKGGPFIYLILGVSIIGAAIVADRVYFLFFKFSLNTKSFWLNFTKTWDKDGMAKAQSYLRTLDAPLSQMVDKVISEKPSNQNELENISEEASIELVPEIEKRISFLALLANISTMLGLLGTIHGLIQAFSAVGSADPSQKAALLASGISIALYTTAFGLIIAIPLLIAHTILQNKANHLIDELDEYSLKLSNKLAKKSIG